MLTPYCLTDTMLGLSHKSHTTKHLMTGPAGNSEFCFTETLEAKHFVIPPNSKVEKTAKKSSALHPLVQNLLQFQGARPDYRRVRCLCCRFPRELVSFVRPRDLQWNLDLTKLLTDRLPSLYHQD